MNVGKATCNDFTVLGIDSVAALAQACPDELYLRLQQITGKLHDPCVWDIFAAAIHEARTGERQAWWKWTKVRRARVQDGSFCKL